MLLRHATNQQQRQQPLQVPSSVALVKQAACLLMCGGCIAQGSSEPMCEAGTRQLAGQ
jgi:hypothetical protein